MFLLELDDIPTYLSAFAVGMVASARLTRLITEDDYPPVKWLRKVWDQRTQTSDWNELLHCPFCTSMYVTLLNLIAAVVSHLHPAWWLFNVWLTIAYLAAMTVARDLPPDQRA